MPNRSHEKPPGRTAPIDWRAWLALAWALWWFQAYLAMAAQARSARFFEIVHALWR